MSCSRLLAFVDAQFNIRSPALPAVAAFMHRDPLRLDDPALLDVEGKAIGKQAKECPSRLAPWSLLMCSKWVRASGPGPDRAACSLISMLALREVQASTDIASLATTAGRSSLADALPPGQRSGQWTFTRMCETPIYERN